jgi:hypothetical protein
MFEFLACMLCFGGFAGVLYLLLWVWPNHQRKGWRAVAKRLGWKVTELHAFSRMEVGLEVTGLHKGRKFSLRPELRPSGGDRNTVYKLRLELGGTLPKDLSLKSEGLGSRFLNLLGSQDEQLGDAELDSALELKQLTPQARAVLLAPPVRQRLLAMHKRFHGVEYFAHFTIENGRFEAEFRPGVIAPRKQLEEVVTLVLGLADALDAAARSVPGAPGPGTDASSRQR